MPEYIPGLPDNLMQNMLQITQNKPTRAKDIAQAVAGAINEHYKTKEMKLQQAKKAKTQEIMGAIDYLSKNNLLQIKGEGAQPIPAGMQEILARQGVPGKFSQPREKSYETIDEATSASIKQQYGLNFPAGTPKSIVTTAIAKVGDMTVSDAQHAQVLAAYKDKPEVFKKLTATTQPGMKYTDFVKSVQKATEMPTHDNTFGKVAADVKTEMALKDKFDALTKEFRATENNFTRIKASTKEPTAAGDLSLIYQYMKMLDPTSVVRESEFATAAATGSYGEKIKAYVNKLATGERLSDAIRQDFVNTAQKLYDEQVAQYDLSKKEYRDLATRYGLNPDNVVIEMSGRYSQKPKTAKPGAAPAATPAPGKRVIKF